MQSISPSSQRAILLRIGIQYCSFAFLFYDHILTFADEIDFIWRRPMKPGSYLFLINRYVAFFGNTVVSVSIWFPFSAKNCSQYKLFRQSLLVAHQALVCAILYSRIYAMFERSRKILAIIIISALSGIAVSAWSLLSHGDSITVLSSGAGCTEASSDQTGFRFATAWELVFFFDCIIASLTAYKTMQRRRQYPEIRSTLLDLLIRDGMLYFCLMASSNLANVITFYAAEPLLRGCLSSLSSCLSVTMASRLMLNIRQYFSVDQESSVEMESMTYALELSSSVSADDQFPPPQGQWKTR